MRKIFKAAISTLLITGIMCFSTVVSAETILKDGDLKQGKIECLYSLDNSFNDAKNCVVKGLKNMEESIDISKFKLSKDSVKKIMQSIFIEHPELFYVNSNRYVIGSSNGVVVLLKPIYLYDRDTTIQYNKFFEEKTNEALLCIEDNMSDFEKALVIHDYIVLNCEYNTDDNIIKFNTAYDVLVNGEANCEGYSKAYSYLLSIAGIDSEFIESSEMNHAWNKVKIDDAYYNVDVTWDDPVPNQYGIVNHNYFLFSDNISNNLNHYNYETLRKSNDTKYDNLALHNAGSKVCYLNNKWYTIVNNLDSDYAKSIVLFEEDRNSLKIVKKIDSCWKSPSGNVWNRGFSSLDVYQGKLYYNTQDAIYSFNPENLGEKLIAKKDSNLDYYGFMIDKNCIYAAIKNNPNERGKVILAKEIQEKIGDVNGDGSISIIDATMIQRHLLKMVQFSEEQKAKADINKDGQINIMDSTLLQRKISGLL